MPVHFAGFPSISTGCTHWRGIAVCRVVEDAAHAIGSAWRGSAIGALGDLVCFSFHPNKTITTHRGRRPGAVRVRQETAQVELHRFHGLRRDANGESEVYLAGGKSNLTDVAACRRSRPARAAREFVRPPSASRGAYLDRLSGWRVGVLPPRGDNGHSWHLMTVLLPFDRLGMTRGAFIRAMRARGHRHRHPLFRHSRIRALSQARLPVGLYPRATRIGRETVSLPLFPAMTDADVDRVCVALRR